MSALELSLGNVLTKNNDNNHQYALEITKAIMISEMSTEMLLLLKMWLWVREVALWSLTTEDQFVWLGVYEAVLNGFKTSLFFITVVWY